MDFGDLANNLTAFLAPVMPYLQEAGGKVADELIGKLGEGVWDKAKGLWTKLLPRVEEKEAAREAVQDLAQRPADPRVQGALAIQLEKILASDPGLAAEVAKLLEAAGPQTWSATLVGDGGIAQGRGAVAAGAGGIAVGGNVGGSVTSHQPGRSIDSSLPGEEDGSPWPRKGDEELG